MNYNTIIKLVQSTKKIVFSRDLREQVNLKGEADFVTAVDLEISRYLKEKLRGLYPDIGFMSEEEKGEPAPKRWILDPIDGTTNLVYNYNMSSVSLALCDNGQIVFGVVYNPFSKETFVGIRGKGATLNKKPLESVRDLALSQSLIEFGAGSTIKAKADVAFSIAREVFLESVDLRRICSSAMAICYIAAGRLNGYFEEVLKPWDYAAASLILEECGGRLMTWDNEPLPFDRPSSIVCGSPEVAKRLLEIIKKHNVRE